jgi:flagellar hook-length control protein FliK
MAMSAKPEKEWLQQETPGMKTETVNAMAAERPVLRQGDSKTLEPVVLQSRQPLSEDSFEKILDQIVRRIRLDRSGDTFRLDIRLKPEFLGRLHIETVMQADQSMKTVIQAEDPSVKALLESKIPLLLSALGEVGLNLETVQVQTLLSDLSSEIDQDGNRQNAKNSGSDGRESRGRDKAFQEPTDSNGPEDFGDGRIHFFI